MRLLVCRGLTALVCAASGLAFGQGPLFKVGIVTDTHIGRTVESCERIRRACALFRTLGVDLVHNYGDVADVHCPEGYVAYRAIIDETYADLPPAKRPRCTFTFAAHDAFYYMGALPRAAYRQHWPAAFADMQRLLGCNAPWTAFEFRGYQFVIVPQYLSSEPVEPGAQDRYYTRYEQLVAEACRKSPGRPVFLFCHVPPAFTMPTAGVDHRFYEILCRYPQVVNLSGHSHASLRNEQLIWQREFTSVNCGCLQVWRGYAVLCGMAKGDVAPMPEYGALVMEVFADKLVFRRYDVRNGSEYRPETPWSVPLPFVPKTAPYREKARVAAERAPQFAAGATVSVACSEANGTNAVMVSFPHVTDAWRYRVELEVTRYGWQGAPQRFFRRDAFGPFWMSEAEQAAHPTATVVFPSAALGRRSECRVTVTPEGFFRSLGKPIQADFVTPDGGEDGL